MKLSIETKIQSIGNLYEIEAESRVCVGNNISSVGYIQTLGLSVSELF